MAKIVPDRNAWGVYEDDGGKATGGYCSIAVGGQGGDGLAGKILLVAAGASSSLRRTRRKGRSAGLAIVVHRRRRGLP